ncbi:MAG: SMC-Scp complex subunit ScpB [Bryobacteraceae bacterium]|nr:SMC-Scp complex subunit ScpB [Bryobacteraceae bacterium]
MDEKEMTAAPEAQEATPEQLGIEMQAPAQGAQQDPLMAILEAIVYVTDEPLTAAQIADALGEPRQRVAELLEQLVAEYNQPHHGLTIREVAGGYKMSTKPEHHEAIRAFVKKLQPPLKLSLAALETLAVIAYKQPVTAPEIMEIRGVQGAGVLKTLLDRKLITTAGRKNVVGRPILYKTTKEFLVQFGLKDLSELPTLKEFEELRRMALGEDEAPVAAGDSEAGPPPAEGPVEASQESGASGGEGSSAQEAPVAAAEGSDSEANLKTDTEGLVGQQPE